MTRQDLDNQLSVIFEKHGTFFAFSKDQFNSQKKDGIKYNNCGGGMICPTDNTDALFADMDAAITAYHEADIVENGKAAIIWRELANHEAQIQWDITDTVEALAGYGITKQEVEAEWPAYQKYCQENDLF